MLIDIHNPFSKRGIDLAKKETHKEIGLDCYTLSNDKGYKPSYAIYKINVEPDYYYDIEIVLSTSKINSYNLRVYEENEKGNNLSYNLDDLKRLFKFTLYPKKNIYIQITNVIKHNSLDVFKISFSKKKYTNSLVSADNID